MVEDGYEGSRSLDLTRFGRRLWDYLLALGKITETLAPKEPGRLLGKSQVESLLQKILPGLRLAFNSEVAFAANEEGRVSFTDPEDSDLVGKYLPDTPHGKALMERGAPLVAAGEVGEYPELDTLAVRSLLVVRLETRWGQRFVGVCNGRNVPGPYMAEDKKFLNELMKVLASGLVYGHRLGTIEEETKKQEERWFASDRYFWARLRGEWDYLSRASEDYARSVLKLERQVDTRHDLFDGISPDNLLADYLDAELCKVMRNFSPSGADQRELAWEDLLRLCLLKEIEGQVHLFVNLRDNQAQTKELQCHEYRRTALAIARICLCAGYFKHRARVPEIPPSSDLKGAKATGDHLESLEASDLFWTLPDWLLTQTEPGSEEVSQSPDEFEWQIDWMRTWWQKIHYLARDGMSEPRREWLEQINLAYKKVWRLTIGVLQSYLEDQLSGGDLCVDSDWLITWLASNVLLSKCLERHYDLALSTDDEEPVVVSPAAKMRYVMYLSQHILYALHCARHTRRKRQFAPPKDVKTDIPKDEKHVAQFQRPPFADVPVGLAPILSEAQLYVLSEYAYQEIGVHRELCIFDRLLRQLYYELPLYLDFGLFWCTLTSEFRRGQAGKCGLVPQTRCWYSFLAL